jgi:hypothetical protein
MHSGPTQSSIDHSQKILQLPGISLPTAPLTFGQPIDLHRAAFVTAAMFFFMFAAILIFAFGPGKFSIDASLHPQRTV